MKSLNCAVLTATLVLLHAIAGAQQPGESKLSLEIKASSMEQALNEFAQQTGLQLIFPAEEVTATLAAPPLVGSFTPQGALDRLLVNSGLYYQFINVNTVVIRSTKSREALAGKRISTANQANDMQLAQGDSVNAEAPDAPAENSASLADESNQSAPRKQTEVETIIVTAQKREERLQDVPMSISAITADEIDRRGLVGAEDYLRGIPGVNQVDSNLGPSVVIRGIETMTTNQNLSSSGSTVAMYFGETPTTRSTGLTGGSGADIKLVDIQRIEVLRGPQGTAFGDAALGGAVRVIPEAPKLDRFEGKMAANYSVTSGSGSDNNMIQAIGNLPLIQDKLAVRASAYRFDESGFYRNRAGSDSALRGPATVFGAESFSRNEDDIGANSFTGGRIAALFQPVESLKLTFTYLTQETETDGWIGSNRTGYDQAFFQIGPEEIVDGQTNGGTKTDIDLANAVVEYDLGWGNVLATYSHINGGSHWLVPWTAFSVLPVTTGNFSDHKEQNGEIRLATKFEGPWNFLVGAYAEEVKDEQDVTIYWYGDPDANILGNAQLLNDLDTLEPQRLDQKAIFGEVSWQFMERFTLTGGVRLYEYERSAAIQQGTGPLASPRPTIPDLKKSGTSGRANLSYKLNDDAMLYASWADGFRLGKPRPPGDASLCDPNNDGIIDGSNLSLDDLAEIESDSVDSYEIGTKFTVLDRRMQISADVFRIDWSDIPVQLVVQCGDIPFGFTANAGGAKSEGVEVQVSFQGTDSLRVDSGASWTDAKLTTDVPAQNQKAGDRLPSPKVSANLGLQYSFSIWGHEASLRTDSTYVGSFNSTMPPTDLNTAGDYVKIDASARMRIRNASIELFGRNLTNENEFTFRPAGLPALRMRPRTIGIQIGYDF